MTDDKYTFFQMLGLFGFTCVLANTDNRGQLKFAPGCSYRIQALSITLPTTHRHLVSTLWFLLRTSLFGRSYLQSRNSIPKNILRKCLSSP